MKVRSAATIVAVLLCTFNAHAQGPCLTASKFGPTDQIGNLNHLTPEKTLAAAKLVTKGKSYRLGIETNKDTPAYPPRTFGVTIVQPGQNAGTTLGPTRTTYNDDIINGWAADGAHKSGCTACNRCVSMMYLPAGTHCILTGPQDAALNLVAAGA